MAEDKEKVCLAYISMDGSVGYWFLFWKEKAKNRSWAGMKDDMVARFGGRSRGTVFERLAAIKQTDSMEEFIQEFEAPNVKDNGGTTSGLFHGGVARTHMQPGATPRSARIDDRDAYRARLGRAIRWGEVRVNREKSGELE